MSYYDVQRRTHAVQATRDVAKKGPIDLNAAEALVDDAVAALRLLKPGRFGVTFTFARPDPPAPMAPFGFGTSMSSSLVRPYFGGPNYELAEAEADELRSVLSQYREVRTQTDCWPSRPTDSVWDIRGLRTKTG